MFVFYVCILYYIFIFRYYRLSSLDIPLGTFKINVTDVTDVNKYNAESILKENGKDTMIKSVLNL